MTSDSELKHFTPEDFVKEAQASSEILRGYVAYDPKRPNYIMFGTSSLSCPQHAIPLTLIESIKRGPGRICFGAQPLPMWYAEIILKKPAEESSHVGSLMELVVSLVNASSQGAGGCPNCSRAAQPESTAIGNGLLPLTPLSHPGTGLVAPTITAYFKNNSLSSGTWEIYDEVAQRTMNTGLMTPTGFSEQTLATRGSQGGFVKYRVVGQSQWQSVVFIQDKQTIFMCLC